MDPALPEPPRWIRSRARSAVLDVYRGPNRQFARALTALAAVTVIGTGGFMYVEGWGLWRALYFTLITITTVGYGDEGISEAGRRFAVLLLIGGIGTVSFSFAVIVQSAIESQFAWRQRMQKRIDKLENHVIVCGFGCMGSTVARKLKDAGLPVVVIDIDGGACQLAVQSGFPCIEGTPTEDQVLVLAGIDRARALVAAVSSDVDNIVITLTAHGLQPDLPITARAERPPEVRKLKRAGASRVVSPFVAGGLEVANSILHPGLADFLARSQQAQSEVAMAEVRIGADSPLAGRTLADYGRNEADRISFVSLERDGEPTRLPPKGADVLEEGDLLIVAGDPEQLACMAEAAGAGADERSSAA